MLPILANQILTDESQKRMSLYLGKLFEEGELLDVIAFSQQELEAHPLNFDLIILRACSILVLQVSGTVKKNEALVAQALQHLEVAENFVRDVFLDYDDSLSFYIALGHLVLGQIDQADKEVQLIAQQLDKDPDAMEYYTGRREFWRSRRIFPFRHNNSTVQYLS